MSAAASAVARARIPTSFGGDFIRIAELQRLSTCFAAAFNTAFTACGAGIDRDLSASAVDLPMKLAGDALEDAIAHAPPQVRAFLEANRAAITRSLGGLQAAGGLAEGLAGGAVIAGGAVTAEAGVDLPLVGAGAWMAARGYDDWNTGLKALVSGVPQDTGFYKSLRDFGFSDDEAQGILVSTSGLSAATAAGLPRQALEQAADRALVGDALRAFPDAAFDIQVDGKPLWSTANIVRRGDAWEVYDAARTGLKRTPPGFKTFDQMNADGTQAVSNKTLDLDRDFYKKETPSVVNARIKKMVDDVANFKKDKRNGVQLIGDELETRDLHLLLPAGRPTPGQASQIRAAQTYARQRGVSLKIFYAK